MKNSFNLEVCFGECPLQPYEWSKTSILLHTKVTRVSSLILKKCLAYEGRIGLKGNVILSDGKNAIALKLADDGQIKRRSFLKYCDELDVAEYACNLKEQRIESEFSNQKVPYEESLSIEVEMKKYLVEKIQNCKDEDMTKYLYYLFFDEVQDYSRDKLLKTIEKSTIDKNMKLYKFLIES